jgi:peptidylprolyl isomerase
MSIISLCAALVMLAIAGCGGGDSSSSTGSTDSAAAAANTNTKVKPKVTVPSAPAPKKLTEKELVEGTGAEAKPGDEVTVQYVGVGYESGEEFDASWDRGEPFSFHLGAGEVIAGWDKGVAGISSRRPPRADHPARHGLRPSWLAPDDRPERNADLRDRPARGQLASFPHRADRKFLQSWRIR